VARRKSNSERIAHAAAEAAATAREKAEARKLRAAAKATAPKKRATRKVAAPQRMKMIWVVRKPGKEPVATFPYRDKAAAQSDAKRRGKTFVVGNAKVPMDDDE